MRPSFCPRHATDDVYIAVRETPPAWGIGRRASPRRTVLPAEISHVHPTLCPSWRGRTRCIQWPRIVRCRAHGAAGIQGGFAMKKALAAVALGVGLGWAVTASAQDTVKIGV